MAWRDQVGPLVAGLQHDLGLVRYVQTHADAASSAGDAAASALRGCPPCPYDGAADYWWPSQDMLETRIADPAFAACLARIAKAEALLTEPGSTRLWLAHEFPQVSTGRERVTAGPCSPLVKLMFVLQPLPALSDAAARHYWLTHHGPLIRSRAPARGMTFYQQVHRHISQLADELAGVFGGETAAYMGHAEAWFDRSVQLTGPEFDAAKAAAIADEAQFIDFAGSFLFSGKEYQFVNRDWML